MKGMGQNRGCAVPELFQRKSYCVSSKPKLLDGRVQSLGNRVRSRAGVDELRNK